MSQRLLDAQEMVISYNRFGASSQWHECIVLIEERLQPGAYARRYCPPPTKYRHAGIKIRRFFGT
jgi:hypothetical protein